VQSDADEPQKRKNLMGPTSETDDYLKIAPWKNSQPESHVFCPNGTQMKACPVLKSSTIKFTDKSFMLASSMGTFEKKRSTKLDQ